MAEPRQSASTPSPLSLLSGLIAVAFALVGGLVLAPAVLIAAAAPGVAQSTGAIFAPQTLAPSVQATQEMPPSLMTLYLEASLTCVGMPWQLVASVAAQESNHGQFAGATVAADGTVAPPIRGVRLDGSVPGTMVVRDTDGGVLDGDALFDRAVGPFQFLPGTWIEVAVDANGDGDASPDNMIDAAHGAVRYLCGRDGIMGSPREALFRYNRAVWYGDEVLQRAAGYAEDEVAFAEWVAVLEAGGVPTVPAVGDWALPVDGATIARLSRPHHNYPAWDFGAPVGTPLYAMTSGRISAATSAAAIEADVGGLTLGRCGAQVSLVTDEGATIRYCHLQAVVVQRGDVVSAGQLVGYSGGQPGAPGAGNTTGPHLHLQIDLNGLRCPQDQFVAILAGEPKSVQDLTQLGCFYLPAN